MRKKLIYTVDVELDLHDNGNRSVSQGLLRFEKICDKHKVKPVLFVVGGIVKKNKKILKRLSKKGWDISLHGYSHIRFDDLSYKEKEQEIKKSLEVFKKELGIKPKGFRAPQHSFDSETLDLLQKYGFEYDSSYFPLNLMQLAFFPKRLENWFKGFFSKTSCYEIKPGLKEIPTSSFILPYVSLVFRILPIWKIKMMRFFIRLIYEKPMFYCHSWDFVDLPESRIDKLIGHDKFLDKLDKIMETD